MNSLAKFSGPDLNWSVEFTHPNIWEHKQHSGWSRLLIGAREREIAFILDLRRDFTGPFAVLCVLVASRLDHDDGSYQNPEPIDYNDLELFLYTFQEFFEQDDRHHIGAQNKDRPAFSSPPFMPTQCAVTSSLWRTS